MSAPDSPRPKADVIALVSAFVTLTLLSVWVRSQWGVPGLRWMLLVWLVAIVGTIVWLIFKPVKERDVWDATSSHGTRDAPDSPSDRTPE